MRKKSKFKSWIMSLAGLGLVVLAMGTFIVWEVWGKEAILYEDVLVLSQELERGQIVNSGNLTWVKVDRFHIPESAILDSGMVIGQAARHFVPAGIPLHPLFFEDPALSLAKDQFIAALPRDWIHSVPGSLRRKDRVVFYPLNNEQQLQFRQHIVEDNSEEFPVYDASDDMRIAYLDQQPFFQTTVAYVRDGANREVRSTSVGSRLDSTANIAGIEIIVTLEQLKELEDAVGRGQRFIILYQD